MPQPVSVSFLESRRKYITEVVDPLVEDLVHDILSQMPDDPVDFSIAWMKQRMGHTGATAENKSLSLQNKILKHDMAAGTQTVSELGQAIQAQEKPQEKRTFKRSVSFHKEEEKKKEESEESSEDSDDNEIDEPPPPVNRPAGPRQSVSAEAYGAWNKMELAEIPVYKKTLDQKIRLEEVLSMSILFSALEEKDFNIILNALELKEFEPNQLVIREGEDGDCLYIVDNGSLECRKVIAGEERTVKTCHPGDVFGELALLYNIVRQASVYAGGRCVCWRLDRQTFNQVVKTGAAKRTQEYDIFVSSISLFSAMGQAERSRVIDSFKISRHKEGDVVVREGDQGDRFYLVEEGTLIAQKEKLGPAVLKEYGYGEYFGELALLKNQPRAATITVTSAKAKLVWMDRKTFNKMLGPLQEILERRAASYG